MIDNAVQFIDAGGNNVVGNVWGNGPHGARYNYLVTSAFSALTGLARAPNLISKASLEPTAGGAIYQTATPFLLTAGVDVADAVISQGAETEYNNRTINGLLTVNTAGQSIQVTGLTTLQYMQLAAGTALNGNNGNGGALQHSDGTGISQPAFFDASGNVTSTPNYGKLLANCGTVQFSASTTASLTCSWVTVNSTCALTWATGTISGGALGYTTTAGHVINLTATTANSALASAACSVN